MARFTEDDVRLEHLCETPLFVPDDPAARAAKAMLEAHFLAEWNDDIDATMASMVPDVPFQRVPALGVSIEGAAAVRDFYLKRFESWPGPALTAFRRATIGRDVIIVEGVLETAGGAVASLSGPAVIVVDFRDGLILGETVYASPAEPEPGTSA